jgi:hypothetical protein
MEMVIIWINLKNSNARAKDGNVIIAMLELN